MSETDTTSTYPALVKLEDDQRRCVEKLRGGFEKEADAFEWVLELIAVSFGYNSNNLIRAFHTEQNVRASLVTTTESPASRYPLSQQHRRHVRHQIEEMRLVPVFQRAYKDLRTNANEYVDPENRPSPSMVDEDEDELPIALRPSLQGLHDRQKEVLNDLLSGFEERVDILDWARSLNAASHGEVPENMINGLTTREATLKDHLLGRGDKRVSKMMRYKFASQVVLPAFNNGVRTITGAAGERSTLGDDPNDGLAEELGA